MLTRSEDPKYPRLNCFVIGLPILLNADWSYTQFAFNFHTTMNMRLLKPLLGLVLTLMLTADVAAAQVTVFAAASLSDSLKKITAAYEMQSSDKIVFNFAASGTLARQIVEGAPADIFISADETRADLLDAKGLLVHSSRRSFLGNSLVIVGPPDSATVHSLIDLTNATIQRVALGDPKIVPAGTYAKEHLLKVGLWSAIEPKIIPCENVRSVLAAVESGNVDAGIVYKTDAAVSKKVKVLFEIPVTDGPKISYPVALIKNSQQPEAAKLFYKYLATVEAGVVFQKFGFIVLDPALVK